MIKALFTSSGRQKMIKQHDGDEDRKNTAGRRASSTLKMLHVVMTLLVPSCIGFHMDTSYLIQPTTDECPWSESVIVAGGAAMMAVLGLTGLVSGRYLDKSGPGTFIFLGCLSGGVASGLCGITVLTCRHAPVITQIVYIVSFGSLGICIGLNYIAAVQSLLSWFPNNRGRANAFNGTCRSLGSVAIAQLLIFCQRRVRDKSMRAGTIYFALGIIIVGGTSPFIHVVQFATPRLKSGSGANGGRLGLKRILRTKQFMIIVFAYFANLLPAWGVEGRLDQILKKAWGSTDDAPVEEMAMFVLLMYTCGRMIWVFFADCVGIINVWKICSLLQAGCSVSLPWAIYADSRFGAIAAVCLIAVQFALFSGVKGTLAALCSVTFGTANSSTALGAAMTGQGLAGLLGPLICQLLYSRTGSYKAFFLGVSVLPLLSFVFLWFVKPMEEREEREKEPLLV